jgi:hypothetical protein
LYAVRAIALHLLHQTATTLQLNSLHPLDYKAAIILNICIVIATQLQQYFKAGAVTTMSIVRMCCATVLLVLILAHIHVCEAGERPYFVTYDQTMEEPGNLEIEGKGLTASPDNGNAFLSGVTEFEYGAKGWWTTEFYLDGQTTQNEGTLFTGFRWENRFRLLMKEHKINPVFYVEYENVNGADKSLLEVVGFDSQYDGLVPNKEASREWAHEIETRLILSSNANGWNISENFIAEKNLAGNPWEFGYAVAASRPFSLLASADECVWCRENFQAGIEFFGGLGTADKFTLHGTSQYVAPTLSWQIHNAVIKISPTIGMTSASYPFMLRFGVSYEVSGFGRKVASLFH